MVFYGNQRFSFRDVTPLDGRAGTGSVIMVGLGLGSKLYMNRPGVVTRFPAEQQTDSVGSVRPLGRRHLSMC